MTWRGSILALGFGSGLLGIAAAQDDAAPTVASTAVSELYSEVSCTSTNAGVNADLLEMAADTRDQLGSILGLGNQWRFPVHIVVVMPDDPLAGKVKEERVMVNGTKNSLSIEAALPSSDPDARTFVQRQYVTALLWEKFFAKTHSFDTQTRLDVVPLWLIVGLNEWLFPDSGMDREAVVRRAALAQRAPSLDEITSWQEISDDRLLGIYQRAFCYYLVNSLIHTGEKRANFQQWLNTFPNSDFASAKLLFPTETGWQQQLLQAPARSHDLVYTWEDSATALASAETIAIAGAKPADTHLCTLETVLSAPRDKPLVDALQKKIFDLTALELRAHPSWRPILAEYRFGLTALVNNEPVQARALIRQAVARRSAEMAYRQKLTDYVNWFEVTKNFAATPSRFEMYFSTAQEMGQVQADPDHPNPIRADLIKEESRL